MKKLLFILLSIAMFACSKEEKSDLEIKIEKTTDNYSFTITKGTAPFTLNVFSKSGSPVFEEKFEKTPFEKNGETTDGNKLAAGMYTFVLKDNTGKSKDGIIYIVSDK